MSARPGVTSEGSAWGELLPRSLTWLAGRSSSGAAGLRTVVPHWSWPEQIPQSTATEKLTPPKLAKQARKQGRAPKMEIEAFYDLISEVSAFCFCHILFIKNESLNPA